jgi:predicted TIM-barrel fold metal-dependent hydrolase
MTAPATNGKTEVRISSDSHVAEPFDLWETRMPAAVRDQALSFPDLRLGEGHHTRPGGWDPKERLKDMAFDGVSAEVLYPSLALGIFRTRTPELAHLYSRAYDDWMIDFCSEAPDRLWGQAAIPLWDIGWAVGELERCRKAGLPGVTTWLVPPDELPFYSDHYERFWAAAQDLQMPVSMHINAGPPTVDRVPISQGVPSQRQAAASAEATERRRPQPPARPHRNLLNAMNALADIVGSGVLQRFPGVRVVIAEVGVGWIPYWLEEEFDRRYIQGAGPRIGALPSEYFYRQVFATFLDDAVGGHLLSWRGADTFMWSNDYPHERCIWPQSAETIQRVLGDVPEDIRAKTLCHNVTRLYGMPVPAPVQAPSAPLEGLMPSIRWHAPVAGEVATPA